jgi:hypothetical protein
VVAGAGAPKFGPNKLGAEDELLACGSGDPGKDDGGASSPLLRPHPAKLRAAISVATATRRINERSDGRITRALLKTVRTIADRTPEARVGRRTPTDDTDYPVGLVLSRFSHF